MQALLSRTTGKLLLPEAYSGSPVIHHLLSDESWGKIEQSHLLSTISDWEEIEAEDNQSLVTTATSLSWLHRATSMLRCALIGVSRDLELEVLEHVEELLETRASPRDVLCLLLVAPLREPGDARRLAQRALAVNYSAVASLLESLADLQPPLGRLVEHWLKLPEIHFADLGRTRQEVWCGIVEQGRILGILEATSRAAFTANWNDQVFSEDVPASRSAIVAIGAALSARLYACGPIVTYDDLAAYERDFAEDEEASSAPEPRVDGSQALRAVIAQVNAIATAVAKGRDGQAERFLRQLVGSQERQGNTKYAVKTLCNVAQRCADMFRADFEELCLQQALRLDQSDPWTLIQWGNHLKRVGDFQGALDALRKAAVGRHVPVATTSLADVWTEQGEWERAISVYKTCPSWETNVSVRTGIADVCRYQGAFEEAIRHYDDILVRWPGTDRAIAGKAEIAKKRGQLDEALALYDSLLQRDDVEDRARPVYYSAKCTILKQANRLPEAYELADQIVQRTPFLMSARAIRGAILGLLGREVEGLKDVPARSKPTAFREWLQAYVRGLLLLKLDRNAEARRELVETMKTACLTNDDRAITRLGAAYSFVREKLYGEAHEWLREEIAMTSHDCFADYLFLVLRLHVAVAQSDRVRIAEISERLDKVPQDDKDIVSAVDALRRGDFERAIACELTLLLRLAA